jgi:4-amino-4-deoxy-L-arabinose transferase-like glycosyltransferase
MIGNGFGNGIPQRPLYIVFLTVLHVLAGQDYGNVIVLQTLIFAFFPVLLYLFGREFLGRPIGISIALLAILRDVTSNLVSPFTGNISYSKLYLSEIPTAMLLILFLWVGVRWIKSGFPVFSGFLMGGILGVAMLIRTQVVVAFPVILLIAFLCEPKKLKLLFRNSVLMLAVLALIVVPWLWRNWQLTGSFIFDSPESQTINLALRYSRINGIEPEALPLSGESNTEYTARLKQIARDAILSNPVGAVKGIISSFLNHAIDNVLLFPLQNDLKSSSELLIPADAFWEEWEGTPTSSQLALILFYVFLLGLGVAFAWYRNGWLGLLPLAMNLAYNLWTSLALLAGQRFLVTMDWSIYLYYMLGLFALLSVVLFALENGRSVILKWYEVNSSLLVQPSSNAKWRHYVFAGILFLGVGVSLPLAERIFPQKYPQVSQSELAHVLLMSPALYEARLPVACLQEMLAREDVSFQQGLALYPRYYEAKGGESFTDSFGYKTADQGRLVFTLLRDSGIRIVFPMDESPLFFPHASDVTLVHGNDGTLWFAFVKKGENEAFYISDDFDASLCK